MGFFSLFSSSKQKTTPPATSLKQNLMARLDKEFYSSIVDGSHSMILYFFVGEGWIGANKTFFAKMACDNMLEYKGKHDSIRDMFVEESEEIFTESDKSWLDYIKKHHNDGYKISIKNAQNELLNIKAYAHTSPNHPGFYILELEDITKLTMSEIKTEEVKQLKTKFLANIGHEFRTPMNGVLGFVELMAQTNLDAQQKEYLQMIHHSSRNLMTNIETLLDLSQLQGGRLELEQEEFNLLPQMEKLASGFSTSGKEKGIQVLCFIDPKLPTSISSDSKKINQIMFSLVQNAIKFTPRGGKVIIEVKLLKRLQNGDCSIGFGVRDNGQGISAEQIANISEPFTSGNHADERLGVGLTLSNGLVELLGSKLKIQSKEDTGTYVNFVLDFKGSLEQNYKMVPKKKVKVLLLDPKKIEEANFLTIYLRSFAIDVVKSNTLDENVYSGVDALYVVANQDDSSWMLELGTYSKKTPIILLLDKGEKLQTKLTHIVDDVVEKPLLPSNVATHLYTAASIKHKSQQSKAPLEVSSQMKALVVEDNLINQRLIQILLQGYKIDVVTASNGLEAVRQSEQHTFDIIFMDIDMPEKNGIDATKEIKDGTSINKVTPIVALTAMAMNGDKEMLMQKGLDNYLSKPLTRDKLEDILQKYLKVTAQ